MARTINLYEAKTHRSELVEQAAAGEAIIIAEAGKPRARLLPLVTAQEDRQPGGWKGRVWIADDFDARLPDEILEGFEGRATEVDDEPPEDS